jgi:3-deoxy-D-manno-octulosonic-acid transferase
VKFILNALYLLLLLVLGPWILWRIIVQGKNRQGWIHKLTGRIPVRDSRRPCVWIHAVSVGEVNLLPTVVQEFRRQCPEFEFAISTTTRTGFELALKRFPDQIVFYCPFDFSWAVKQVLQRIRPQVLVLTELELWPNLINVTRSHDIPVALMNGRISDSSFRGYQRLRFLFARIVKNLDLAAVQTESYASRLADLGLPRERIHVCGNIKFDNVADCSHGNDRSQSLGQLAGIGGNDFVLLAGSTQENEDRMALAAFQQLHHRFPCLKLILVPRHPDRCVRLARIIAEQGLSFSFRSRLNSTSANTDQRILVVDVIGELNDWWGCADVGYVGGSLGGRGGQNMIEPAARGIPICFGTDTSNFRDVVQMLLADQAAVVVENAAQLQQFVCGVIGNPDSAAAMGGRAAELVRSQQGAASRTVTLLRTLLSTHRSTRLRGAA